MGHSLGRDNRPAAHGREDVLTETRRDVGTDLLLEPRLRHAPPTTLYPRSRCFRVVPGRKQPGVAPALDRVLACRVYRLLPLTGLISIDATKRCPRKRRYTVAARGI